MLLLFCSFRLAFEGRQPLVPELVQEGAKLGEALGPHAVEASGGVASFIHEPGLLEDGQMLGDRRPRHVEMRGDLSRRELLVADEPQDLAPARSGDRLQCSLHARYVSICLRKCQLNIERARAYGRRPPTATSARTQAPL